MEETYSKLNSTQKIVVKLLQQLISEYTDWVPAKQPCTVASTTGYRVYRPVTGYTALYSLPHPTSYRVFRPSPFNCVDSGAGRQQTSTTYGFNRPVTESTDQPALKRLLHISRLQSLTAFYQPAPRINQPTGFSTSWPLFISSLFIGLRLMTGLIMCSP